MPELGNKSNSNLLSCHSKLITVCKSAIEIIDFTVLCGYRGQEEQNSCFDKGLSKLKYPDSRHNKNPSIAVDLAPYPIDWDDKSRFIYLAGIIIGIGKELGVQIRWGGDWNSDRKFNEKFIDMPHFELMGI